MISRILKFAIGILGLIFVLVFSLDIQSLEKHRTAAEPARFDATDYALKFWNKMEENGNAGIPRLVEVLKTLNENPKMGFASYGKKLGISKVNYFMVQGEGKIESMTEEYIQLLINQSISVKIATDFIYGNSVRDGSGKVNIDDFLNMTDFNAVSVAINKLVREKVVVRLQNSAAVGKWMEFTGAFEISEENMDLSNLLILPVSAKLSDGKSE